MAMAPLPTTPDAAAFRALARSSPWRWRTLRFVHHYAGLDGPEAPVRAWIDRPDGLRVERVDDGELLTTGRDRQQPRSAAWLTSDGSFVPATHPLPEAAQPELRDDGLVARRPWDLDADAPMWRNYLWVALLDPVELADGREDDGTGTVVTDVLATQHHDRPAWQATVRPLRGYDPRCPCCPLLLDSPTIDVDDQDRAYEPRPHDVYDVRLDVETGVCVSVRRGDGDRTPRLDVVIEGVDEDLPDDWFTPPRRGGRLLHGIWNRGR